MPYVKTGRPPGRPRKPVPEANVTPDPAPAIEQEQQIKPLERAREGFRRAAGDPAADLHRPPRYGQRKKTEVGRRPILHPNVIKG
jgi:hypothetical protein